MVKYKIFGAIIAQFIILLYLFGHGVLASEYEKDIGDFKPKNIAKVIRPSDVSKIDLKKIKKIAVLVTSTSPLFGQVAEDLLAVKLSDMNLEVVERTKVSEVTVKELGRIEKQMEMEKGKQQEEILNIIKIGKSLDLNAVIVGTLFEGRRQISFSEENPPRLMDKIVVSTFHLQIIDTQTEKVMLSVILEYDKGENIINAVDTMTKIIKDEIGD